ncbi:unnamed protein product, partial [Amoebophrya sp. A120]|eukprot:GSA120T00000079001.1
MFKVENSKVMIQHSRETFHLAAKKWKRGESNIGDSDPGPVAKRRMPGDEAKLRTGGAKSGSSACNSPRPLAGFTMKLGQAGALIVSNN